MDMTRRKKAYVPMGNRRTIYLAGGCFWGVEGYFQQVPGVFETETGYANGTTENTANRKLKDTDYAETVKVCYDISVLSLEEILLHYFRIINPTSTDRQGDDVGREYRYFLRTNSKVLKEKNGKLNE